ncbi:hypothetical protein ACTXG6_33650 [Pseudonocardia sp. Cha107L01]|uniref:hypothetical protein n=1 Tax=Pseudonocardia sp. Cha107L01 TaxID=3457576 RepID=UPI00403EAF4C
MIVASIWACAVFGTALVWQLYRRGALAGAPPRRGGWLYPDTGPTWLHLLVNHVTVSWTSRAADTIAPLALLALAGWLSMRWRRPTPLICVAVALATVAAVVFAGKGFLGRLLGDQALVWDPMTVSGPATAAAVVVGLAAWLTRHDLGYPTRRALWCLAAAVTAVIGVSQLYLGHRIAAVALSLAAGVAILALTLGAFGRVCVPNEIAMIASRDLVVSRVGRGRRP